MTARHSTGMTRNGLPVDMAKQRAWQQRAAKAYDTRRRAGRNRARLTTTLGKRRNSNDWPPAVRRAARRRSGGVCELNCYDPATDLHHRKHRRHGDHTIQNALHVCRRHHDEIHSRRLTAEGYGWIVHSSRDPAAVAVAVPGASSVFLTTDGRYQEAA